MIDTDSHPGAWADALQPDHRSLRTMTEQELNAPGIIAKLMRWHGLQYAYEARDILAAERLRRTRETHWDG
jgi:hypothetical protein